LAKADKEISPSKVNGFQRIPVRIQSEGPRKGAVDPKLTLAFEWVKAGPHSSIDPLQLRRHT